MPAHVLPVTRPQPPSASVVVITDVDSVLRLADSRTLAEARPALDALVRAGSPVVLFSSRSARELRELQQELGIRHPFISDGGAALHIPSGYFCSPTRGGAGDDFETIDFGVRRPAHAVRLLVTLYRAGPILPVVVGIGHDWRDRVLLREVDVPIVIRDAGQDQRALLRNVPHAYLTDACGDDGLAEVIFGHCSVGLA